jgi:hypothetical protein
MKAAQRIEAGPCSRRGPRSLHAVRYLPRRLTWELVSSGRMPISCAHSISHAETFVFFVLGQGDDGIRVTSEYAAFHKVPSRGALQSFVGDFTAGGGKVLSADIDAIAAVETSSNPPEEEMGSSPHERQEAIHIVERQLPKSLKLFRGEDSWFAGGRQGQLWEYGTGKLGFTVGDRPYDRSRGGGWVCSGPAGRYRGQQEAQ